MGLNVISKGRFNIYELDGIDVGFTQGAWMDSKERQEMQRINKYEDQYEDETTIAGEKHREILERAD